ncbi:hypothetical protein AcidC75_18240 [Acidisoma sp. C75]
MATSFVRHVESAQLPFEKPPRVTLSGFWYNVCFSGFSPKSGMAALAPKRESVPLCPMPPSAPNPSMGGILNEIPSVSENILEHGDRAIGLLARFFHES